ncbi:Stage IV sporulation protein A [uncultured Roseburia sp.]|uniref:Stage IV sporulation protein A n=1 Tax=Brotonthovivens ammoniilytica TaxID=2981725 RepID=A0ABT2TGE7_9FIRM|nr:stage IV sporulation protein A [Brotonthovivens ammoniilytica]MCU6760961.1 stage IV sporulation protein A [Brotonthovivens ammoniilytica]SCI14710.1 Stage IV sporulation protein A [uncultured Roseburia sp.]
MDKINTNTYDLYRDIQRRTNGEIYLGVVGPVRSGKSTFIKRFMDLMVLPNMEDASDRERTIDELPQSAQGKTIMTTEPKFIPKEAANIFLAEDLPVQIRLIDCVGFLIEGANGHMEEGNQRMVKTPWMEQEIPFSQAASIGTEKVIKEHATIGIVVTTDGSFTEIPRENYVPAEEKTIAELKEIGKPFVVLLNTPRPYQAESEQLAQQLSEKYQVQVLPVNCEQLKKDDINRILKSVLYEFPITRIEFFIPKWVEMLESSHKVKEAAILNAGTILKNLQFVKDAAVESFEPEGDEIKSMRMEQVDFSSGNVKIRMDVDEKLYYENMSEMAGMDISGEYQLISLIRELASVKKEYEKVAEAMQSVQQKGYGVVLPSMSDIQIEEPQLIRHGNKYGVKLKASSPSIHMIRANVETEIAPIIGSEDQAKDLVSYILDNENREEGLWETNIFGKSIGELVEDGINRKITMMDDDSQMKLQDTMQKIVNDSNGGLVCIII